VQAHALIHARLASLALLKGVKLPQEPSITQKARLQSLSELEGANYDYHFIDSVGVVAHETAIKLFRKAAASSSGDADVKAFALASLATLTHQLRMARVLQVATAILADRAFEEYEAG